MQWSLNHANHGDRGRQNGHFNTTEQANDTIMHAIIQKDTVLLSSATERVGEAIGSTGSVINQIDTIDSYLSYLRLFNKFAMGFSGVCHMLISQSSSDAWSDPSLRGSCISRFDYCLFGALLANIAPVSIW